MQIRFRSLATLLTAVTLLATGPALAAGECKGKDQKACDGATSCRWVDSYVTKKGNKVDGYCRSTGKSQTAKKTPAAKPETTAARSTK